MARREPSAPSFEAHRPRIGTHYEVVEELGRGGMACVYRVVDARSGKHFALKQLRTREDKHATEVALLFEREFHTLAQLAHPHVIEVYDFGFDPAGAFYTMELLDEGDLRERSPWPWREACELIFDVCSSLALLHSRRLVHRDVSPRNVRCSKNGHAKLIDFGAMVPMGTLAQAVGTPPFVAPEAVHATTLDARTDLFSLGATLYFALTGQLAYPARSFAQLVDCWRTKPPPPSAIVPSVPPQLDRLVMSLISLEAALRPRSAFEVMQHLTAIAGITRQEPLSVSQAYLVTPSLIAREAALGALREALTRGRHGRGLAFLTAAPAGLGRSRLLDACVLEATTLGCCVLRATASGGSSPELAAARTLAEQLLKSAPALAIEAARSANVHELLFEPGADGIPANDNIPSLRSFACSGEARRELANGLAKWFLRASRSVPLLITADDVDHFDDTSIALLATLAYHARSHSLIVLASATQSEGVKLSRQLNVLANRCEPLPLRPLQLNETEQLLGSVFGDVPNLALLSAHVQTLAIGNPREIMQFAQHLVDCGTIRYDAGSWSLPLQLTEADLPASATEVIRMRAAQLGPLARRLAEAQALSLEDQFLREDYASLEPEADAQSVDRALSELETRQLLIRQPDRGFKLDRVLVTVLGATLDAETRRQRYRALARAVERRSERHPFSTARLWLLAGETERALDMMLEYYRALRNRAGFIEALDMPIGEAGPTLLLALQTAEALHRQAREAHDFRHWITLLSASSEDDLYGPAAPAWRTQLERDSGLIHHRALSEVLDPGQRLMQALTKAAADYAATPERDRVYPPDEGIRMLVHYVVMSIAESARRSDMTLAASLPDLLEPFAPLSPLIDAIWNNALAVLENGLHRHIERANRRWLDVYERLANVSSAEPEMIVAIRYAIAYAVGTNEASLGIESAIRWAALLDRDPMQRVSAMYLRKTVRLQQGDLEGAEAYRKQAELLALQSSVRPMFNTLLPIELGVHATAWDLTGVKELTARIAPFAERHPGWVPIRQLGEAHYLRLLGDLSAAEQAYARAIELSQPCPEEPTRSIVAWPTAVAARSETLIALDRASEAQAIAAAALRECERREIRAPAFEIARALGLAEAKLGDFAQGAARIDALIEEQRKLGITGLGLGLSYEARARAAIWAGDRPAIEHFSALTAEQYRHGRGSTLGARCERLIEEARDAGMPVLPPQSPFEDSIFGETLIDSRASPAEIVALALADASDPRDRAERALSLVCEVRGARGGHLFLAANGTLQLAASSVGQRPDDMLERLMSDFWSHHGDDSEPETALVNEDVQSTQVWSDREGKSYRPWMLTGMLAGTRHTAGVVLLEGECASSLGSDERALLAEVATYLLRSA